jgi:SAM-dependent methyltransferase
MDPKQIFAQGYDHIAEYHSQWASRTEERQRYTNLLLDSLPPAAKVLELGCGVGLPTTLALAQRFQVTGIDISARHVALAQHNVPNATFVHADMTRLTFPSACFDAVAAFYSIIHVPREEHPDLLRTLATWLKPGGLFVAAMGNTAVEAQFSPDWLGAPMYWSHFDNQTNQHLIQESHLQILSAKEETAEEDGVPVTFLWVVAQKPLSQERGSL